MDKTCYTCNAFDCNKTPARKTCSNWIGDEDILKCKCGSSSFKIELNCKLEDVVDDTAMHKIICSECNDDIHQFDNN